MRWLVSLVTLVVLGWFIVLGVQSNWNWDVIGARAVDLITWAFGLSHKFVMWVADQFTGNQQFQDFTKHK